MIRELARRVVDYLARLTNPNRRLVRVFGARHVGGVWLTHDEALRLSAVWACVSVISKAIASSTWDIFQDLPNGDREYLPNSKAYMLLNIRPNAEMTALAFHETMLACALLWGNSYAEIERDQMNRPIALWPLEPWRCWLTRGRWESYPDSAAEHFIYDMTGELAVRVENYDRPDSYLHYNDVYHIHGLGLDGSCGLDLVGLASRSFLQTLAAERFALKYYEHGTSMGGVLTTEKELEQDDIDDLKKNIKDRVAGVDNAFEFLVVGGGLKYEPLTGNLRDGQFNDTRYFLIEEACRWFGVPPHKIQHLLHATFSNIEHLGIEFNRDGLRPWRIRCEQEADFKLLPNGPFSLRIDTEWTAEGDSKTRAEEAAILVSNGLIRRNEWRRKVGRNSLGAEGELLTVQAQLTTLAKVAQAALPPVPPPTQPPGGNDPGEASPQNVNRNVAQKFLALAFMRILKRQIHRAEMAAKATRTRREFEMRLDNTASAHLYYVQNQMMEVQRACADVGIVLNLDSSIAKKVCAAERDMLIAAYEQRRSFEAFCNIEQRAKDLASEVCG